jgi:DNA end-binding protein Ku
MAQAVWTGSIAFGLVNVPVKLYTAVTPKDVRFHQFQRGTNRRIRYARVTDEIPSGEPPTAWRDEREAPVREAAPERPSAPEATRDETPAHRFESEAPRPEPVPYDEVVKGYEIEPGRFVTVTREELEALAPQRTAAIDIDEFVDLADIDPVYFEKTYYVAPANPDAVKPYSLLLKAMAESRKVAVGRFVMRTKEYLAAIRPMKGALALHTLYYDDEVRAVEELPFAGMSAAISDRELQIATQLISVLAAKWEPERYRDTYRERVLELIESKAGTDVVETAEPEELAAPRIADLMDALRKSVEAAKEEKRSRAAGQ